MARPCLIQLFFKNIVYHFWMTCSYILITFNLSPEIGGNCGRLLATDSSVSIPAPSCSRFRFWVFLDLTTVKESLSSVLAIAASATCVVFLSVSIPEINSKPCYEVKTKEGDRYKRTKESSCSKKDPNCHNVGACREKIEMSML